MSPSLRASVRRVLFAAGVLAAGSAAAQNLETKEIAEIVIVTGSYIRGTPEDAALPVDVISSEELEKQGAPSALEMIKALPVMNGIIGESNQFTAGRGQAQEGSASINLRGFGAARTLVLLNGKRVANDDANLMPSNAIARVEVLKDGAAATYGSDAIGGVVNFITRERVEGLSLNADYRAIEDSDGDYNAGIAWGASGETADFFVAANYFHRSQLLIRDRDWAVRSFQDNPQGGWSTGANPGAYSFLTAFGLRQIADPNCEAFGGTLVTLSNGGTQCQTQFTQWDNLVEEQESAQFYLQGNVDLTETTRWHVEALYATTYVPHANTTPSYTTSRRITRTVNPTGIAFDTSFDPDQSPFFTVPAANPGLVAYRAQNPAAAPGAGSAFIQINQWRPFFAGGNPLFGYGESFTTRQRSNTRLSTDLSGEWGTLGWTTSLTFSRAETHRREYDIHTGRLQLALRGLGGADCNDIVAGQPGSTCQWLNPFSTGVPGNPLTGFDNPDFDASTENSVELVRWLTNRHGSRGQNDLAEFDFVVNSEMPLWSLGGGNIGWAAGVQYRHGWQKNTYNQFANSETNPCPDTLINGSTTCTPSPESPYTFLATNNPIDVDRGVYAMFGELNLPVSETFNVQIAARFEDYGNKGGSSFDPKLALRWQALDFLALRGSVGTTFRAPPLTSLINDEAIGFADVLGSNRPIGTTGNPDLEPEEAFTFSVGTILTLGNFRATLDYWKFDIDKLLTVEPRLGVLNLVFPGATGNNCATTDPAFLAAHFDFAGGVCGRNNVLKLKLLQVNGAGLINDGVDLNLTYTFENVMGGSLLLGAGGTWIHKYETEAFVIGGVTVQEKLDGTGKLNTGTSLFALPEWRAQGYLEWSLGTAHTVRWTTEFIDQYIDQRNIFTVASPLGQVVESTMTHDLTYRVSLPWETTLLATIENLTDEEPSFARTEISYDPLTGNPLGRTFKIGLRKEF